MRGSVLCLALAVAAFGQRGGGGGFHGGGGFAGGAAFRGGGGFRGGYGDGGFRGYRGFLGFGWGYPYYGYPYYGYGWGYPYGYAYPYGYGYCDPYSGYGCGYSYFGYGDPQADPQADPPADPPSYRTPMRYQTPSAPAPAAAGPAQFSIALRNGVTHTAVSYWVMAGTLTYVDANGEQRHVPLSMVDRARSAQLNNSRGVDFALPAETNP